MKFIGSSKTVTILLSSVLPSAAESAPLGETGMVSSGTGSDGLAEATAAMVAVMCRVVVGAKVAVCGVRCMW